MGQLFSEHCHHHAVRWCGRLLSPRHVPQQDAAECAPSVRPAHEDPRSSYDHLNEHVLVRLWDRVTTLRGQQGANHKHHRRRPHGG